MKRHSRLLAPALLVLLTVLVGATAGAERQPANGKLKIFILSGQSNMVGFGQVAGSPGTMETYPEFKGNVAGVETRDFQRSREESPSGQGFHWMRTWETYYLIGKSMGDSMIELLANAGADPGPRR